MKLRKLLKDLVIESFKYNGTLQIHEENETNGKEEIQMYLDIISMNPEKYDKYIKLLKDKYNINFYDYYNDEQHILNANLNDIKKKKDFLNYENYLKYAKKIYSLRNIPQPKYIDKTIDYLTVKNIGEILGFNVKFKDYVGIGNYASCDGGTIVVSENVDVNTLIHEIGHFFCHISNYDGYAKTITMASTSYGIGYSDEVFAENFLNYFISPTTLKKYLPEVFNELDSKIPKNFKVTINKLIK